MVRQQSHSDDNNNNNNNNAADQTRPKLSARGFGCFWRRSGKNGKRQEKGDPKRVKDERSHGENIASHWQQTVGLSFFLSRFRFSFALSFSRASASNAAAAADSAAGARQGKPQKRE